MGALVERTCHGESRSHAANGVADREASAHWPLPGVTGDRHDAAHGLNLAVIGSGGSFRTGLAEARHSAVNEPRIDPRQRLVANPHAVHDARAEVLHCHVGLGRETVYDLDRLWLGQVEGDVALVGIDGHPGRGHIARRPCFVKRAAAHIFATRPFDLDHVRAEQRQLLATEGTCKNLREIKNADTREWFAHAALSFVLSRVTPASSRNSLATAFCLSNSARRRSISSVDIWAMF